MAKLICSGATGKCSVGSIIAKLSVISSSIKINDCSIALDDSYFDSFGFCSIKAGPCTPNLLNWESTYDKIKVSKKAILTEKSIIRCSIGGCIAFVETGQELVVVEDD